MQVESDEHLSPSWLRAYLDPVSHFPKAGVTFQWYRPLLETPEAFSQVISCMAKKCADFEAQGLVALDSRGFLFAGALCLKLNLPVTLIRKRGKLPPPVLSTDYVLEYGGASFELEMKSTVAARRMVIIDDVIATGGSISAAADLIRQRGGIVAGACSLIDLTYLDGKNFLKRQGIDSFAVLPIFSEDEWTI